MMKGMELVASLDTFLQLLVVSTCVNGNADVTSRYEELTKVCGMAQRHVSWWGVVLVR